MPIPVTPSRKTHLLGEKKSVSFFFGKKKMIEEPEETCASPALVCCLCLNGIQTVTSECCRPCAAPSAPWEIFLTCAQSIAPEKKVKRERKKEEKAFGFHDGNSVRADTHAQKEKEEGSCVCAVRFLRSQIVLHPIPRRTLFFKPQSLPIALLHFAAGTAGPRGKRSASITLCRSPSRKEEVFSTSLFKFTSHLTEGAR